MPLPRYERERDALGQKQRRVFLYIFGFALLVGLITGLIWVAAGLINVHVLR